MCLWGFICNSLSAKEGLGSLATTLLLVASPEASKVEEFEDMDLSISLLWLDAFNSI